ncbi:MAG: ankyrin repeat domain-containing protein [Campylobacterales bacterium]
MRKLLLLPFLLAPLFAAEPTADAIEAVKKGDAKAVAYLVKTKEEANAALPNGKNLLMLSVWEGKKDVALYLISKGADVNAADKDGKTPLMLAVWRENLELAKLLVSKGADYKVKNKEGLGVAEIAELTGDGDLIDYINSLK